MQAKMRIASQAFGMSAVHNLCEKAEKAANKKLSSVTLRKGVNRNAAS